MAIVNINYDCGCGYHAKTVEEAARHADDSHHTLNVAGTVRSSERKVRKIAASPHVFVGPRLRTPRSVPITAEVEEEHKVDFGDLRARLQKGQ